MNKPKRDSTSKLLNTTKVVQGPYREFYRSRGESIRSPKSAPSRRLLTVEQFRREAQIGRATVYKLIASVRSPTFELCRESSESLFLPLRIFPDVAIPAHEDCFT